jgi:hypothetical protein
VITGLPGAPPSTTANRSEHSIWSTSDAHIL